MKILFVCENYLPHYGGAEVVFKNLAERYVKKGHSVSLVTHQLKGTKINEDINNVSVYRIPSLFSRYIFTFFSIPKVIRLARKSDIIQTTTFNGAFPAWLAGKLTGKPVVLTVHEVWVNKWKEVTDFSWLKSVVHNLLERCIYFLPFDKYVCVSNATKNDLLKIGIQEEKVETIHNGFDYEFWVPENFSEKHAKNVREKLGAVNKFVYFSWGRPGTSKGFEYVIKAVKSIKEDVPDFLLVLMFGSVDKYKEKYKKLISLVNESEVQENIAVIKSVPYEQLGILLKAADCIVVPSIAEGFGYNAVEATAMNKPVIVSDAGSLPEIVSGKHLIFNSKNACDLAKKMVEVYNGRVMITPVKKFEWDDSIDKYLNVYNSLIRK